MVLAPTVGQCLGLARVAGGAGVGATSAITIHEVTPQERIRTLHRCHLG